MSSTKIRQPDATSILPFINLSAYQFTPLDNLTELKANLLALATAGRLRGTILLSVEGINLFVAGTQEPVDRLLMALRAVPGLAGLKPKESQSAEQPFNRMLVKIKKEIIAFGVRGIDPARRPTRKLPARTLKQWLDECRPITLLDTRNDYEIRLGTFRGAVRAGIENFRVQEKWSGCPFPPRARFMQNGEMGSLTTLHLPAQIGLLSLRRIAKTDEKPSSWSNADRQAKRIEIPLDFRNLRVNSFLRLVV